MDSYLDIKLNLPTGSSSLEQVVVTGASKSPKQKFVCYVFFFYRKGRE